MLRRNKALSIVMTMCLCLALLAPVFVAPPAAEASSTYEVIRSQTVSNVGEYLTSVKMQIDIPNVAALAPGDLVTIHMPADVIMENSAADNHKQTNAATPDVTFTSAASATDLYIDLTAPAVPGTATGAADVSVEAPATIGSDTNVLDYAAGAPSFVAYPVGNSAVEIKITTAVPAGGAGRLYVNLLNCKVNGTFDGDIKANIAAPDGSGFSSGVVTFAKYASGGGGTLAVAKSVVTIGTAPKALDSIMIQETAKNTLQPGDTITLKLPNGFKWARKDSISAAWGFATSAMNLTLADVVIPGSDERKCEITMPAASAAAGKLNWNGSSLNSEGRIYFYGTIEVDDEVQAKLGEVTVSISGDNVTDQDLVVANYAEYGVTVSENKSVEVKAGWDDTELGSFNIKENMQDSIVPGRTVTFELPSGVEWDDVNYAPGSCYATKVYKGTNWATAATKGFNKNTNILKFTLATGAIAKSDIDFKDFKVRISPDFSGDLIIKVGGTAGVEGEVKVATVVPPVTMSIEKANDIIIGKQGQVIEPILLTEGKKEAIKASTGANIITLRLPGGATFDKLPKIEVTEGDILIDKVSYTGFIGGRNGIDIITKSTSDKLSTIKLSDIVVTADRTVPEGDFKLYLDAQTSSALTNQAATFNVSEMGELLIGKCVTPAPADGTTGAASGEFRIESNIYKVNGVSKIMDTAPYIKNDRTYVPVRFLGYALGLTDADILWDEATQKVVFTKGDASVELTIGSTTYLVNGESGTMDVAPEITNNRTMLPARYVAEGLGFVVGWDPATKTVLVSK